MTDFPYRYSGVASFYIAFKNQFIDAQKLYNAT